MRFIFQIHSTQLSTAAVYYSVKLNKFAAGQEMQRVVCVYQGSAAPSLNESHTRERESKQFIILNLSDASMLTTNGFGENLGELEHWLK